MDKFIQEAGNTFLRTAISSHRAFEDLAAESEQVFKDISNSRPAPLGATAARSQQQSPPLGAAAAGSQQQPALGPQPLAAVGPQPAEGAGSQPADAGGSHASAYKATKSKARAAPVGFVMGTRHIQQQAVVTGASSSRTEQQRDQQDTAAAVASVSAFEQQRDQQDIAASAFAGAPASSSSGTSTPSAGAPASSKRPRQTYTTSEVIEMQAESAVAAQLGLGWAERGPPPSHGPLWRNQEYRPGSERWANRGGAAAGWYTAFYKAKRSLDKAGLSRWLDANPKPSKG
jgi:hypothetical protein